MRPDRAPCRAAAIRCFLCPDKRLGWWRILGRRGIRVRLVVFTDLDGTLLDHASYSHAAAAPALAALARLAVPLVLASSKTVAEIAPLQAELNLRGTPVIAENGAARCPPGETGGSAATYARLRAALAALPQPLRAPFTGFGDMSDREVAEATGLPPAGAALARQRQFTEPGLWGGTAAGEAAFVAALASQGIAARRGGRFLTLSFGGTKAGQMAGIARDLGAEVTLALGDAPNDREMIEAADHGVVIRNDHGTGLPPLPGEATGRIRRTTAPGPEGWNRAVLDILDELGFMTGAE